MELLSSLEFWILLVMKSNLGICFILDFRICLWSGEV